jgi:hypothetical protein
VRPSWSLRYRTAAAGARCTPPGHCLTRWRWCSLLAVAAYRGLPAGENPPEYRFAVLVVWLVTTQCEGIVLRAGDEFLAAAAAACTGLVALVPHSILSLLSDLLHVVVGYSLSPQRQAPAPCGRTRLHRVPCSLQYRWYRVERYRHKFSLQNRGHVKFATFPPFHCHQQRAL